MAYTVPDDMSLMRVCVRACALGGSPLLCARNGMVAYGGCVKDTIRDKQRQERDMRARRRLSRDPDAKQLGIRKSRAHTNFMRRRKWLLENTGPYIE